MTVLSTDEIKARIAMGEIFREGTWSETNFWQAKYDLRMADDFMVVPDTDFPEGRRYRRGERRTDPVILDPGDVAFISTAERLCLPWDLVGNIGPKFGVARKGLLVLTGFLIDPGFGLKKAEDGTWQAKEDERLHFLVANLSRSRIVLRSGEEAIASVQFLSLDKEVVNKEEIKSTVEIEHEFFADETPMPGLAFFHELKAVRDGMAQLRTESEIVQRGTSQLIFFGVFLFFVTLLATATAVTLALIQNEATTSSLRDVEWPGAVALLAAALAVASVAGALAYWGAAKRSRWSPSR